MSKDDGAKKAVMKYVVDGKEMEISFEQLTLVNNSSLEALTTLLIQKGIIKPDEFVQQLEKINKTRYRYDQPD